MALQSSGAISLQDLKTEFGDTGSSSLSEFYRGGSLVPNTGTNAAVPTSGQISLTDFYGAAATAESWQWVQTYTSMNEGVTRTFQFEDVNDIITSGSFNWSINGTTADFNAVSGTGTISATSQGSFSVTTKNDATTEGTENYTLSVSYGGSTVLTQAFSVLDTSLTPVTINVVRSTTSVNEGSSFTFSASASTAITGTVSFSLGGTATGGGADYTTSGASGSFTFSNSTTSDSVTITTIEDATTEGAETVSCIISSPSVTGFDPTIGTGTLPVTINDTSVTPSYALTRSVSSVNEGGSFTITFTTNQSGSFAYTISGVSSADINGASLTGSVTNNDVLTFNVTEDATTEGAETFNIALDNGQASTSVTINDTSVTPSYALTRSVSSVNEGGSFTITFTTNQSGSFAYTITGVSSGDINGASLTGSVTNNDVLTFNVTEDATTEGTETFNIALDNGQASTSVTINDTSTDPTFQFSAASYNVTEGQSSTITVNTTNVSNGTTLYWRLASDPGNDIATDSGSFTINSNTGTFSVSATFDSAYTESTETLTLQLSNLSDYSVIKDTADLNIINVAGPSVTTGTTSYKTVAEHITSGGPAIAKAETYLIITSSSSGITVTLDGEAPNGSFGSLTTNSGNSVAAYTVSAPGSNLSSYRVVATGSTGPTNNGNGAFDSGVVNPSSGYSELTSGTSYSVGTSRASNIFVEAEMGIGGTPLSAEIFYAIDAAFYFTDSFGTESGPYNFDIRADAKATR